jgi:hypothetical protein
MGVSFLLQSGVLAAFMAGCSGSHQKAALPPSQLPPVYYVFVADVSGHPTCAKADKNLLADRLKRGVIQELGKRTLGVVETPSEPHLIDAELQIVIQECGPTGTTANRSSVILTAKNQNNVLHTKTFAVNRRASKQYDFEFLMGNHYPRHVAHHLADADAIRRFLASNPAPAASPSGTFETPMGTASDVSVACSTHEQCQDGRRCEKGCCTDTYMLDRIAHHGDVSLVALQVALRQPSCVPVPNLTVTLENLKKSFEQQTQFANVLYKESAPSGSAPDAYRDWLVAVHTYLDRCGSPVDLSLLAENAAPATERQVEDLVEEKKCATLKAYSDLGVWPYEQRFAREIVKREFSNAEITRKVWLGTLNDYQESCSEELSRRQKAAIDVHRERLERIVGLDDEILIRLRSALLTSLEKGDDQAALSYLRAVSEREAALDSRHKSNYEARVARLASRLTPPSSSPTANAPGEGEARKEGDALQKFNEVLDTVNNVNDTMERTVDTVRTTKRAVKSIMSMF